jgi:ribonucleoside-diphosphate reductase alpha chain
MTEEELRKIIPEGVDANNTKLIEAVASYSDALEKYAKAQLDLKTALNSCANKGVTFPAVDAIRFRLPDIRKSITHKVHFVVDGERLDMYLQPSFFSDGRIGEVFMRADKQGSFVSGLIDGLSIILSLALQYGVPLDHIIEKLKNTQSGVVSVVSANPKFRRPKSVLDYLSYWLERATQIQRGTLKIGEAEPEEVKIDQSEG